MSGDSRWTGGIANRGWQSGIRPQVHVDRDHIVSQVRACLADVRRHQAILAASHPSERHMLQVVYTGSKDAEAVAVAAYQQLTGTTP